MIRTAFDILIANKLQSQILNASFMFHGHKLFKVQELYSLNLFPISARRSARWNEYRENRLSPGHKSM